MNKLIKIVATIILIIMIATILVNASVLFMAYAGLSMISVVYGIGVLAMLGIEAYEWGRAKNTITIGDVITMAVLSMLSVVGLAWYLFGTIPALAKVRDFVVIGMNDKE